MVAHLNPEIFGQVGYFVVLRWGLFYRLCRGGGISKKINIEVVFIYIFEDKNPGFNYISLKNNKKSSVKYIRKGGIYKNYEVVGGGIFYRW